MYVICVATVLREDICFFFFGVVFSVCVFASSLKRYKILCVILNQLVNTE